MITPASAPSTPASNEPPRDEILPSSNSAVSSPRYQTFPSPSCAYQSKVSSIDLAVGGDGVADDAGGDAVRDLLRRVADGDHGRPAPSPPRRARGTSSACPASSASSGLSISVGEVRRVELDRLAALRQGAAAVAAATRARTRARRRAVSERTDTLSCRPARPRPVPSSLEPTTSKALSSWTSTWLPSAQRHLDLVVALLVADLGAGDPAAAGLAQARPPSPSRARRP